MFHIKSQLVASVNPGKNVDPGTNHGVRDTLCGTLSVGHRLSVIGHHPAALSGELHEGNERNKERDGRLTARGPHTAVLGSPHNIGRSRPSRHLWQTSLSSSLSPESCNFLAHRCQHGGNAGANNLYQQDHLHMSPPGNGLRRRKMNEGLRGWLPG